MAIMTQRSPQTQRIIDYLSSQPNGKAVFYSDIERVCEWDPKKKHLLYSAIQYLAKNGIIYKSVQGLGYTRLDANNGIHRVREWHGGKLERDTKRLSGKVQGTQVALLSKEGREQYQLAEQEVKVRRMYLESLDEEDRITRLKAARLKIEQEKARKDLEEHQAYLERLEQQ